MIFTLSVRILTILFATVALALSAALVAQYGPGHAPSLFDYGIVCGAIAILGAGVGVLACFVESLQGVITLVLDSLATSFLLAGGIAFAATLRVGNCNDEYGYLTDHRKTFLPSEDKSYKNIEDAVADVKSRCRMAQADTAFLWFAFACAAGAFALSFISRRSGTRGSIV